jgi:excinuclease ABC subunit C
LYKNISGLKPPYTHTAHIESILKKMPDNPGIYQFIDENDRIIYVGKAKNLKKRVLSYFNKENSLSAKIRVMVRKIADISFIIVDTEYDALLLENTLIKKYLPRYNVMLKDDKTYPWICIKNEPFPRLFPTRHVIRDGSLYFGPYASVRMMNTLLDMIRQLYQLRNCTLNLSEASIKKSKYKVCLEYHIGNCKAPCIANQTSEDYANTISQIKEIIKGNISSVASQLKSVMKEYAESLQFEKAQIVKEKIETLNKYQSKSTVVSATIDNVDVFSITTDEEAGYVNYLKVIHGAIVQSHTIELKKKLDESPEELLSIALVDFRQRFESDAKEIILPFEVSVEIKGSNITLPQRGDKKQLLDLSERNAKFYRLDKQKQKDLVDPERHSKRILAQAMQDLHLKEPPNYIECFDNSNIQGDYPVSAMVVFKNAKPDKREYRHYNIKTVEGPDDFASMEEVIYRRYKRLLDENKELPQLIIVDGGKGQLSSALESLEKLDLRGKISIIGIAKKLEEIYFPKDSIPIYIDKRSETLKLIQQMRDEAHRFGITHHRKRREKGTIKTELSEIDGIGPATAETLLKHFKSVKKIKLATFEELEYVVGKSKAGVVFGYFQN